MYSFLDLFAIKVDRTLLVVKCAADRKDQLWLVGRLTSKRLTETRAHPTERGIDQRYGKR